MKRAILTLFCVLAGMVRAQTLQVLPPTGFVPPGTNGIVNLSYKNGTGPAPVALQFTVSAPGKDIGTVTAISLLADKSIACNQVPASVTNSFAALTCIMWGLNADPIADGLIAQLTVPIPAGISDLSVTFIAGGLFAVAADASALPLLATVGGPIQFFSACDLNGDSKIDSNDVLMVVVQGTGLAACTTGDLNKDGKCNLFDVYREVVAALPSSSGIAGAGACKVGP